MPQIVGRGVERAKPLFLVLAVSVDHGCAGQHQLHRLDRTGRCDRGLPMSPWDRPTVALARTQQMPLARFVPSFDTYGKLSAGRTGSSYPMWVWYAGVRAAQYIWQKGR
jgi:hypothetical protein